MSNNPIPNLYILGFPKCGTTSLANWIGQHPSIFVPEVKEPHHFNTDQNYVKTPNRSDYLSFYDNSDQFSFTVDASVYYAYSDAAIKSILSENQQAKFIICLRNPSTMMPSLFLQQRRAGMETFETFDEMWSLHDDRLASGVFPPGATDPIHVDYKTTCSIGSRVSDLMQIIPQDQLICVTLEEMEINPLGVLKAVWAFLGVAGDVPIDTQHLNKARSRKFPVIGSAIRVAAKVRKRLGITISFGILTTLDEFFMKPAKVEHLSENIRDEIDHFSNTQIKILNKALEREVYKCL